MAIEFHCPYCTATVRVGDEASGKIGRCPKCDTRLRIPTLPATEGNASGATVSPPPAVNPPIPEQAAASESISAIPDFTAPPPPSHPGQLPVVPATEDPVTSKYMRRRKKKKSSFASWIPPFIFGGILVVVASFYLNESKPKYEGELTAEKLNPNQSIRIELDGGTFNIDQKIFSEIVEELRRSPSSVQSNLVSLKFAAGANGMEMSLRPGIQADLVKVPVTDIKSIASFYKNNFDKLDDARLEEIQNGLMSLALEWVQSPEETKKETLPNYRNSIAYNAFVKGLGRVCYARVGKAIYPCVHEDGSGSLYFLVPIGTESFSIRERHDLDKPVFPSELNIQVSIEKPKIPDSELVPVEDEAEGIPAVEPNADNESETPETSTDTETPPSSMKMMNQ